MATTKKPLAGKKVTTKEEVNAMREEDGSSPVPRNEFSVTPDKRWPSLVKIVRERGPIPKELQGLFTNRLEADKAILRYIEAK